MSRHGARQEEPQAAVMAGRSREMPLFPPALVALDIDAGWLHIATRVRESTAAALDAGDYPIAQAACGNRESLMRLRDRVFDHVAAESLRDREATDVVALWRAARTPGGLPDRDLEIAATDRVGDPSTRLEAVLEDVCEVISALIEARLHRCPISPVDLTAWADHIGWSPLPAFGDRLIVLGDEVQALVVAARGDLIVVERAEDSAQVRGLPGSDAATFVAAFPTVDDAVRFLLMEIGSTWRAESRRSFLRLPTVRPGCAIEEGPTATHLVWEGGSAEFPPGRVGRFRAIDFSQVATASPRLITSSYGHDEGHPIFHRD